MDDQLFFKGGHPPSSPVAFESTSMVPLWHHLAPPPDSSPEKSLASIFGPFSSVVPSPETPNSHLSGEGRELREMMGKVGGFSCYYTTPLSSPPKLRSSLMADGKLSRVSLGSNSSLESTVSDQISEKLNCRKRKANSKEPIQFDEDSNGKRDKASEEQQRYENGGQSCRKEEKTNNTKSNPKAPEPPKDFIHVRARRGQATDSHSLAERVRREKISERMKLLENLVPACNKVTGKALMLDEIIKYVQALQRQVEFLSMKLASFNTRTESAIDFLISKEAFESNNSSSIPLFGSDSSSSSLYGHHHFGLQLPLINELGENFSQYPTFGEDSLQSIIHKGINQSQTR